MKTPKTLISLDQYFAGWEHMLPLYEAIGAAIQEAADGAEVEITKSQVAFKHEKPFAWVWLPVFRKPGQEIPLVLSISLDHVSASPRWKKIVEPRSGTFHMHHIEIFHAEQLDAELKGWIAEAAAYRNAG